MSIDLDILPTTPELLSWGKLKKQLQKLLTSAELECLGENSALLYLGSNKAVGENESL
ncbi:MAG: hypothetical protein F6K24_51325, partial [Okeania sp. SIO2D1]|nr:hypothetical protein [Okeania sp. SIO2D1]